MISFLSKLFIKENQTEYKETLNRFQGEIDAIQSLLDELRTEIEQELPKPKKKVKAKPKKKPAPKPAPLTQREHGELRVQRNNQFKSNSIKKYKELQFDPLDAQLIAFNEKIDEYTQLMKNVKINEDNAESMQKIMIGVEKVLNTRQKLLDAIERRGERKKIKGEAKMSYLEEQMNIKSKI